MKMYCGRIVVFLLLLGVISLVREVNSERNANGALVSVETEEEEDGIVIASAEQRDVSFADEIDPNIEPFEPTKEWQTVKQGQSVPRGLHVRMDMQTGERQAKLLGESNEGTEPSDQVQEEIKVSDSSEPSRLQKMKAAITASMKGQSKKGDGLKFWQDDGRQGMATTKKESFSREELKEALKKFKATSDNIKDEKVAAASSGKQFRSVADLKKELKDLDLNLKSDMEVIKELLERYKIHELGTPERLSILTDLEYYVHQIDNAMEFVDMGGLSVIIQELNHTEAEIRSEAALIVGSAVQSNPKVQIGVLDAGLMHQLTRMLSTENDDAVKAMIIYALSALLRHFPYAQQIFVGQGGVHSLTNLLDKSGSTRIKVKAVTLMNDLIQEKIEVKKHNPEESKYLKQKLEQYESVHILEKLLEQGWCDLIPSLLSIPEHDSREKIIIAMETLIESCQNPFTKAIPNLKSLKLEYSEEAHNEQKSEDTDTYFQDLLNRISSMLRRLELYSGKIDL